MENYSSWRTTKSKNPAMKLDISVYIRLRTSTNNKKRTKQQGVGHSAFYVAVRQTLSEYSSSCNRNDDLAF